MTQTTKNLPNLRLLVLDVDGTLTDGSICMGPAGEVCKLFSVKDGLGIQMLAAAGVQMAVITGRTSEIVARRMAELPVATLGMPATSGWEVYMDAHYGDDVISRIYPNAIRVD